MHITRQDLYEGKAAAMGFNVPRRCSSMGKKAGKAPARDENHDLDFDQFTAEDFDWLDDQEKVAKATSVSSTMLGGKAARKLDDLEAALRPGVRTARDLFRTVASGQAPPRLDLALVSVFADYRYHLKQQRVTLLEETGKSPELLDEYDAAIGHVLSCFDKLLHGEGITRVEALKADAWLRDVPGETLLFN
jgi:hypothetical protein